MSDNKNEKGIELSLLGIFRGGVVTVMLLLILATVLSLAVGIYYWSMSYSIATPAPPKLAPPVSILPNDFLASLQPKQSATQNAAQPSLPIQLAPDNGEARFRAHAEKLWIPVSKYQSDCSATSALKFSDFLDSLRESPLKRLLDTRGDEFAKSQVEFVASVLSNPSLVQLCKSGRQGLFFSTLEYHRNQWDAQVQHAKDFDEAEQLRIHTFKQSELENSASRKSTALYAVQGAAVVFGVFMSLALLLVFARIEVNLRRMSVEIMDNK
jgi:hypothetical protein